MNHLDPLTIDIVKEKSKEAKSVTELAILGNNTNHRRENLRLLCPNCHTQTSTFGSKNVKKLLEMTPIR